MSEESKPFGRLARLRATRVEEKKTGLDARVSDTAKIGVLMLTKYTEENFTMSPEERAKWHKGFDETILKWEEKGVTACWYHCLMMNGKFDAFAIFEVDDLGQWVTMAEEYIHYWSRFIKYYEIYIGVNTPYFDDATKDIPFFKELDKRCEELGVKYG